MTINKYEYTTTETDEGRLVVVKVKKCKWKHDSFPDRFDSGCGVEFILQTDFKFCPYCGGKIEVSDG